MTDVAQYVSAIDTIYPDGYRRESVFRDSGDMVTPDAAPKRWFARLVGTLSNWRMKRAGRLALSELTDDQLHDIGLTRSAAEHEVRKSWLLLP